MMPRNLWLKELSTSRSKALKGRRFVLLHECGISDHVGGQDCR